MKYIEYYLLKIIKRNKMNLLYHSRNICAQRPSISLIARNFCIFFIHVKDNARRGNLRKIRCKSVFDVSNAKVEAQLLKLNDADRPVNSYILEFLEIIYVR